MAELLVKPRQIGPGDGCLHELSPADARLRDGCENWRYVGFSAHRLQQWGGLLIGPMAVETIVVLIEGRARITIGDQDFGELGERLSVFEKTKPVAFYVPPETSWSVTVATTDCELGICRAPIPDGADAARYPAGPIGAIGSEVRGQGSNERLIHPVAMEDKDVAHSLLVTEVFTPAGNWSSYPPHRHDEDDFPAMTYLEETYYHRVAPAQGFGIQRVFTDDFSLDETMSVADRDLVLVPRGHHPCAAPHGYELYYLNVMAGPLRKWRFQNHPDHEWMIQS